VVFVEGDATRLPFPSEQFDVVAEREQVLPVAGWLDQSAPGEAERELVLAAFEAEAAGGPATGLRVRRDEAQLVIEQRWLIVGGVRT
jgi:hypothetical protein